ncbi:SRPBCC family protein [Sphingosinicella rhizophila]|uniref:SRPBCC family protein n=1 Tax=Sphingosinicella rhizophila TaxID=3050082 RepID=A0ABU3QB15_9SPHN|nr:SRPBCC family protein [Sphingosinicella sp. GR2756]MDT9600600.1 SRPBCC family protein [Sphingosinicella sp. GR2756]
MTAQITLEIQAEASGHVTARREQVWEAVADLVHRPNLTSCEILSGAWPAETARARVAMNRDTFEMARTETVIRCVPEKQLLVKIEAPEWGSTAWLDHRIEGDGDGCRLTISAIAVAVFPEGAGPASREEYAAMTLKGLEDAVAEYRKRIEAKRM